MWLSKRASLAGKAFKMTGINPTLIKSRQFLSFHHGILSQAAASSGLSPKSVFLPSFLSASSPSVVTNGAKVLLSLYCSLGPCKKFSRRGRLLQRPCFQRVARWAVSARQAGRFEQPCKPFRRAICAVLKQEEGRCPQPAWLCKQKTRAGQAAGCPARY